MLTAMWETFAIVGMRTCLVYYLIKDMGYADAAAAETYGLATGAAFFAPTIGGYMADRWIGLRRSVFIGAGLLAAGLFAMALKPLLLPGLGLVAVGVGLFRSTAAAQVGALYSADDQRRDRAYSAYYVGCNVGALLAPLTCGFAGAAFGWRWAFVVAGAGMIISIITYASGVRSLPAVRLASGRAGPQANAPRARAGAWPVLVLTWIAGAFFFTAYGQLGGTIALWVERDIDRRLSFGGLRLEAPAAWFQSLNPLLVFVLAPLVGWLWSRGRHGNPVRGETAKIALGGALMAAAFLILAVGASTSPAAASPLWLVAALVPFTAAELYIAPIGQSLFSRLAPGGRAALFIGLWFLTATAGFSAGGALGGLWDRQPHALFFAICSTLAGGCVLFAAAAWRLTVLEDRRARD